MEHCSRKVLQAGKEAEKGFPTLNGEGEYNVSHESLKATLNGKGKKKSKTFMVAAFGIVASYFIWQSVCIGTPLFMGQYGPLPIFECIVC